MLISILGSIGFGLVWGWLVGSLAVRDALTSRLIVAYSLATLIVAGIVWWVNGWQSLAFFLAISLFSFLAHTAWRQNMRDEFESSSSN